jgi:hypothetical protein
MYIDQRPSTLTGDTCRSQVLIGAGIPAILFVQARNDGGVVVQPSHLRLNRPGDLLSGCNVKP